MGQDEEFLEVGGARVLKLLRHFMNAFSWTTACTADGLYCTRLRIELVKNQLVLIHINMREGVAPLIWGCHKYKNRICGMTHQPHERSSQRITNERVWSTKMGYKD